MLRWCVVAVVAFAVKWGRQLKLATDEQLIRADAEFELAKAGAQLRESRERRARLAKALARYQREIRLVEAECAGIGDARFVRERLNDLLSGTGGGEDADTALDSAVSDPAPTEAGSGDHG